MNNHDLRQFIYNAEVEVWDQAFEAHVHDFHDVTN